MLKPGSCIQHIKILPEFDFGNIELCKLSVDMPVSSRLKDNCTLLSRPLTFDATEKHWNQLCSEHKIFHISDRI